MKALVKNGEGKTVLTLYTSVAVGFREVAYAAMVLCCRRSWSGDVEVWYNPRKDVVYINKRHEPGITGNFKVSLEGSASVELLNVAGLSFEVEEG
jgi:hypothetical protein